MAWDFSTEPEFAKKLDWIREFVREEVEPLEVLFPGCEFLPLNDERRKIVDPLKQQVRDQGLWAPHLGPELGGQGFGAVKLTLINEILGRSPWAPIVFGTQAPDTGNAEIIARFGTQNQKDRYLSGLLSGEIFSCFSMTEPQGGADPRVFTTRAVRDGDDWVITGRKYFSSNASVASFFIVVAITNPDVAVHHGASTFLIPADTPGLRTRLYCSCGALPASVSASSPKSRTSPLLSGSMVRPTMCRITGTPSIVGDIQAPTPMCISSRKPWPATASFAASNICPCTAWNG